MNSEVARSSARAQVTIRSRLSVQACVPAEWTPIQIEAFVNTDTPAGTENGWKLRPQEKFNELVRKELIPASQGQARTPCSDVPGFVHVILDC